MPTIEIVSLRCNRLLPIKNKKLPFYIRQNIKLISHRNLFQKELDHETGTILHLGNKEMGRKGYFFGSELIDWDIEENNNLVLTNNGNLQSESQIFKFTPSMFDSIKKIVELALKYSPINKCFFYTDIQNTSEYKQIYGSISINDFISKQYDQYYIFNTLYEINY